MISVQFDKVVFRIKKLGNAEIVFDKWRKKWVLLTPEEWVRQNFVAYLVNIMNYPASHLAIEKEIMLGDVRKRFDVAVFDRVGNPWMIIECKAMDVPLGNEVIEQILNYNQVMQVKYLVVTNGKFTTAFQLLPQVTQLANLPGYGT